MTKRFKIATAEYEADHGPWGCISLGDLMKYTFVDVIDQPAHPEFWTGEWYCPNSGCCAREVTVHVKYQEIAGLKVKCPVCGGGLKFHGALRQVPLLPVEPQADAQDERHGAEGPEADGEPPNATVNVQDAGTGTPAQHVQ